MRLAVRRHDDLICLARVACVAATLACLGQLACLGPSVLASDANVDSSQRTSRASSPTDRASADEIVALINGHLRQAWQDARVSPSSKATENEWCRRVYLDVIGRIPSADELNRFLSDRSRDRHAALVEQLIESDEYVEEYARHWTTIWTNTLIGRPKPAREDARDMVDRRGMQGYLRRSFLSNKPYDRMVYELISATGSNVPEADDYNGAVNFLLDNLQENAATATAKTARYFLGLQVQCTQCHNHPFNDWKQSQFWGMNAFFRQTRGMPTREGRSIVAARLINQDFGGEGSTPAEAEIYYELRNGLLQVAYPTFVDGKTIDASGYLDDVNRRDELGRLIVESEYLSQAIVNRMWAHFLGYGFTKPIDDLGPHNPPVMPELFQRLSSEFVSHAHDLKALIRWITLSDAYAASSRFGPRNRGDDPSLGEKPLFSRFYMRQMQAEQLYDSLLVATEAHKTAGAYEDQERTKAEWLSQFTLAFGTDEGDESTTFNGTIPQALMMMNGELIRRATSTERDSYLGRVAAGRADVEDKVAMLYQAALSRRPTSGELKSAKALIVARGGKQAEALADVWWAVLNSNEFILNH